MTAIVIGALCLAAVAMVLLAGVAARARIAPGPPLRGRTVVVHTRIPDDRSIRGVLVAEHADRLTLGQAVYLHAGAEHPLEGLQHVPLSAIAFVQELP